MTSPLRILVVDDEATIRRLLARFLRGRGCTVDEVADGGEALVRLQAAEYDVVISDVSMPGLDGATLWMRACMAGPRCGTAGCS